MGTRAGLPRETPLPRFLLKTTEDHVELEHDYVHRVRKRLYPFLYFSSRCPVCGEWCKLH